MRRERIRFSIGDPGGREAGWLAAGFAITGVMVIAWPLASYMISLAVFGLPHVLGEFRYVDRRFSGRLPRWMIWPGGAMLALVVLLRILRWQGIAPGAAAAWMELALVLGLAALALPLLWERGWSRRIPGLVCLAALAAGLAWNPVFTLLGLAVLHNLTPLGFIAEGAPAGARRWWMSAGLTAFILVPLVIATGWPLRAFSRIFPVALEWSPWDSHLSAHFGAYFPPPLHGHPWILHLFSAVVFMQLMHYAAVIHLLPGFVSRETFPDAPGKSDPAAPRQGAGGVSCETRGSGSGVRPGGGPDSRSENVSRETFSKGGWIPWPRGPVFWAMTTGLTLTLLGYFAVDFSGARTVYGFAAAVHAWVEWPVLLSALSLARRGE
ncbi:MAG: hypothetical protein GMKNLPBB_00678 [Myxococcota bacterium]|nr:hypothetical protein [Myxococcota bacterium]